ncbi:MAG: DegT/DnrJ/EryC1/StrS family aminotransferase [Rhodospirillales bacterium]|nr:DegT/DnrJ/EryC1/StrS family aminotransferase [Rhodospirillales bacterium]
MIPLAVPELTGNEAKYLQECIDSNYVSSVGPFVDRFENLIGQAVGNKFSVATSTGTAGIHVALKALGVARDDLVILPSYTFIASANAIDYCGAVPWLFDVDSTTWTVNINLLRERLLTECEQRSGGTFHKPTGRRVAAILPVYVLGLPADMDELVPLAKSLNIPVIADAAAAIGATYKGRPVGHLGADLTVYSFNGNKTITAGGGGAVSGNVEDLLAKVRHLTTTARRGDGYSHDQVGFNYRMTNLAAAVGCAQIERLTDFTIAKQLIRRRYDAAIAELPQLEPFPSIPSVLGACWYSGLVAADVKAADQLRKFLRDADIDSRPFWCPVHLQKPYLTAPKTEQRVCEDLWQRIVTLPCSTALTEIDQERVIDALRRGVKTI